MKKTLLTLLVAALIVPGMEGGREQQPVYLDPAKPLDGRVEDLIGRLTLAEKISLLGTTAPAIDRLKIPAMNG